MWAIMNNTLTLREEPSTPLQNIKCASLIGENLQFQSLSPFGNDKSVQFSTKPPIVIDYGEENH